MCCNCKLKFVCWGRCADQLKQAWGDLKWDAGTYRQVGALCTMLNCTGLAGSIVKTFSQMQSWQKNITVVLKSQQVQVRGFCKLVDITLLAVYFTYQSLPAFVRKTILMLSYPKIWRTVRLICKSGFLFMISDLVGPIVDMGLENGMNFQLQRSYYQ